MQSCCRRNTHVENRWFYWDSHCNHRNKSVDNHCHKRSTHNKTPKRSSIHIKTYFLADNSSAISESAGADPGFLKRGGGSRRGYRIFHKHPPPLDIVRVTSSDLRKFEKHPHSWTFTSTPPPWTLSAWRHPPSEKLKNTPTLGHSQKGGVQLWGPMLKSLHCGPKGGVRTPWTPPPLDPPLVRLSICHDHVDLLLCSPNSESCALRHGKCALTPSPRCMLRLPGFLASNRCPRVTHTQAVSARVRPSRPCTIGTRKAVDLNHVSRCF